MSVSICIGTRVVRCDDMLSRPAKYPTTSFLLNALRTGEAESAEYGVHSKSDLLASPRVFRRIVHNCSAEVVQRVCEPHQVLLEISLNPSRRY
jgi:hypothetical protein